MPTERKRRPERAVVVVSIPKPGKRLIERAAARRHQTISEFMRAVIVPEAERILGIEPDTEHLAAPAA